MFISDFYYGAVPDPLNDPLIRGFDQPDWGALELRHESGRGSCKFPISISYDSEFGIFDDERDRD